MNGSFKIVSMKKTLDKIFINLFKYTPPDVVKKENITIADVVADYETRTCGFCKYWHSKIVDHPNYRECNNSEVPVYGDDTHYSFGCTGCIRK